jgi:hypothetical protein
MLTGAPDEYSILRFDGLGPLPLPASSTAGMEQQIKVSDSTTATIASSTITSTSSSTTMSWQSSFVVTPRSLTSSIPTINNNNNDDDNLVSNDDDEAVNDENDEELSFTTYKKFRHIGMDTSRHTTRNTSSKSLSSVSWFQPLPSLVAMLRTKHYMSSSHTVPIALRLPSLATDH